MATRTAASFGARGNGTADDAPAIQRLLDASKPGDVLTFAGSKTYRIGKGLVHSTPDVALWFNGATLLLDTSNAPQNNHLTVTSRPDAYRQPGAETPIVEWDAKVDQGWLAIGQRTTPAWLALGVDPHDPNEEHYGVLVDLGESRVWVPYPINGTHHRVYPVPRVCERVTVRDLRIETAQGQVADANVRLDRTRRVSVSGLRGHVTIGCLVADSEHVDLSDFDVDLVYSLPPNNSAGRVIGAWQSRYLTCDRITFRGGQGKGTGAADGFYFESWCGHVTLDHVTARYIEPAGGWGWDFPTVMVNGECFDFSVPFLRIESDHIFYPYDRGGQAEQQSPRFGTLELVGKGDESRVNWMKAADVLDVQRVVRSQN